MASGPKISPVHILFGADIEFFGFKDGKIVYPSKNIKEQDGIVFEIGTDVCSCRDALSGSIWRSIKSLIDRKLIDSIFPEYIQNLQSKTPKWARQVGCSPSLNTYEGHEVPKEMENENYRSAGGHIHADFNMSTVFEGYVWNYTNKHVDGMFEGKNKIISIIEEAVKHMPTSNPYNLNRITNLKNKIIEIEKNENYKLSYDGINEIVKLYDRSAGLLSVVSELYPEMARARRVYYGRAGSYRIKKYGIEYRVPSSNDLLIPHIRYMMIEMMRTIVTAIRWLHVSNYQREAERSLEFITDLQNIATDNEIKFVINNCDKESAMVLFKKAYDVFNNHTVASLGSWKQTEDIVAAINKYTSNPNPKKLGSTIISSNYIYSGQSSLHRTFDRQDYISAYFS